MAHRYETGHRLRFVLAAGYGAYAGTRGIQPVTVTGAPQDTCILELPVVSGTPRWPRNPGGSPRR